MADLSRLVTRDGQLLWELAKRDIRDRYAGQMLGAVWALGHPLLLMAVYVFIFSYVFRLKIGGTTDLPLDYTTYILSGLVPWLTFQDALGRATTIISSNANLVKQAVFPLQVLPVKVCLASSLNLLIGTAVLLGYALIAHQSLHATTLLVPLLFAIQLVWMVGVAFIVASAGAYFRDLKDVVLVGTLVGLYLMPVFYLPAMVPEIFRPILYFNPFSYLIWCYQDAIYFGRFEHPWAWPILACLAVLTFYGGFRLFRRLQPGFGSVL